MKDAPNPQKIEKKTKFGRGLKPPKKLLGETCTSQKIEEKKIWEGRLTFPQKIEKNNQKKILGRRLTLPKNLEKKNNLGGGERLTPPKKLKKKKIWEGRLTPLNN